MWESAWRQSGELRFESNAEPSVIALESLLDELRLEGDQYKQHSLLALERFFAIREAERAGMTVSNERRRERKSLFAESAASLDAARLTVDE